MKINGLFAVLFITLVFGKSLFAQTGIPREVPKEKKQTIMHLFELTGQNAIAPQMLDEMIAGLRQQLTNVPDEFWKKYRNDINFLEYTDSLAVIYDMYFSDEELNDMIRFFESSTGRKYNAIMERLGRESYSLGEKWALQIHGKLMERLRKEGYIKVTDN